MNSVSRHQIFRIENDLHESHVAQSTQKHKSTITNYGPACVVVYMQYRVVHIAQFQT